MPHLPSLVALSIALALPLQSQGGPPAPAPVQASATTTTSPTRSGPRIAVPARLVFNGDRAVSPDSTLSIAAVGDVLLSESLQRTAELAGGYPVLFAKVAEPLRRADIAFANLEVPTADSIAPGGVNVGASRSLFDLRVFSGYPSFNAHPSVIGALMDAGIRVVNSANNHALDRAWQGIDASVAALRQAGLPATGTRRSDEPGAPWHTQTTVAAAWGPVTIAWLGCTYATNGVPDPKRQVLKCFSDRALIHQLVDSLAHAEGIRAVMVTPHWGAEYADQPEPTQVAWAHEMLDAGATAVLGQHPHVVQPFERYVTADGRETLIAYSLGNFVSGQVGVPRRSSPMLGLLLSPEPSGRLKIVATGWMGLRMTYEGGTHVEFADVSTAPDAAANRAHLAAALPAENRMCPSVPWRAMLNRAPSAVGSSCRDGGSAKAPSAR